MLRSALYLLLGVLVFASTLRVTIAAGTNQIIKLAVNPWTGSAVDAAVAKILLQERLGYSVDLVAIDEFAQFPALAKGDLHATLEVWPSGHSDDHRFYIDGQKTVEDAGALGVVGKIGWYVPTYLVQTEPSLATWQGLKAHTDLFKTAATGNKGQLLEGDPTWVYKDQELINALGLNLTIVQKGSEAALLAAVNTAYTNHAPVLFYFWTPHSIHEKYQLTEVQLPPNTPGCTGCDYPSDNLYKAVSSKLRSFAPGAYRFLKQMHYSNEDQIKMIADVDLNGKTPEQAARTWIQTHESIWSTWFPISSNAVLTTIPAPANVWATNYLYVLDKDTNGVFLNANELYMASIRPLFPEIQSVTNLAGHDDFYFYPAEQANKFRTDDLKIIAGGTIVEASEVNQPVGGVRTIVHVTKVPLRNERDQIIGLRAIWHTHPPMDVKLAGGNVDITVPADASIFHLERTDKLGVKGNWLNETVIPTSANGQLTYRVNSSTVQGYFRLAADQPVKIGALLSLTGDWSSLGKNCQAALQVGLDAANLDQLSSGSPLRFTADVRDTKLLPDLALAQLQQLASNGVKIVIGPQSSAELRVLKPFADANGIILISPSSTASSLAFTNDFLFRFCPDDTYEIEAMVALLKADDVKAVVPIWRDDAGNQGLHDSLVKQFPVQGGSVTAGVKYAANQADFTGVVAELTAQLSVALTNYPGKAAVYLAGFDEVAAIFKIARTNAVLSNVRWYGSDGVVQSLPLAADALAAEFAATHGYYCPTFGLDERYRSLWQPVATLLTTRTGNDVDAFTLACYDAVQVSVKAYRTAGFAANSETLKAAFVQAAAGYTGATGQTLLNGAGDRDGGVFDFWSLRFGGTQYDWVHKMTYSPGVGGPGVITRYP